MSKKDTSRRIWFVPDARSSRERNEIALSKLANLRRFFELQVLPPTVEEADLIRRFERSPAQVILLPWQSYLKCSALEGTLGLSRGKGPTTVGYFNIPELPEGFPAEPPSALNLRSTFIHLGVLSKNEAFILINSIASDRTRSGIRPLLENHATIYKEQWYSNTSPEDRAESLLQLSEVQSRDWVNRSFEIRLGVYALWSVVFNEIRKHRDLSADSKPVAYFHVGADNIGLYMRLCFTAPGWNTRSWVQHLWPNEEASIQPNAFQLLKQTCDFVRVHQIQDSPAVEIVVGFLASSPSRQTYFPTLQVEPIASSLVLENPADPSYNTEYQPLPSPTVPTSQAAVQLKHKLKIKEKAIVDLHTEIRNLKNEIHEKDETIYEFKMGGVGVQKQDAPPETSVLIESLKERIHELDHQLDFYAKKIKNLASKSSSNPEYFRLRREYNKLLRQSTTWLNQLQELTSEFDKVRNKKKRQVS